MSNTHYFSNEPVHFTWDADRELVMEVDDGDIIVLETPEVSDGQVTPNSTSEVIATMDWDRVYPLAGPIHVKGAAPGDVLEIEVVDVHTRGWGWTWIYPGLGLLPDDFTDPALKVFEFPDGRWTQFADGISIPIEPFFGVMGVCPAGASQGNVMPPGRFGGNVDIRQLVRGTKLYLPVEVPGALFSCGDGHAAQGDGEMCVAAIESPLYGTFRFRVHKGRSIPAPQFETAGALTPRVDHAGFYATTGVGSDLFIAAQDAARAMIDHLGHEYKLSAEDAYMLCSLAVDLKISEVVDAGQYVVSAFLPLALFGRP